MKVLGPDTFALDGTAKTCPQRNVGQMAPEMGEMVYGASPL